MSDEKARLVPSDPPPSYEDAAGESTAKATFSSDKKDAAPSGASSSAPRGPGRGPPFPLELPILTSLRTRRVILASSSPRRRQLLAQQLGLSGLEVIPSQFAEDLPKNNVTPFDYVLRTASAKCESVYRAEVDNEQPGKGEPALVLAADTVIVSATGAILEKPRSEAQHRAMLRGLRDQGLHSAVTAVIAMAPMRSARDPGYVMESHTEETRVLFARDTPDDVIEAYIRTREGADRAGGYAIQGMGAILVDRIEGDYSNVVGLPVRATLRLIEKVVAKAEDEETLEGELSDE